MQIGNYILGKTLGKGTFGRVKLAVHQPTQQEVAIKIMDKRRMIEVQDIQRVHREIHILKTIRHPHMIQLYEILETTTHIFLVLEFANNGELYQHIVKNQKLSEQEACKYFQQIISAIEYLHTLGFTHRDIKPENLLLDHKNNIKLIDFGLSNTYSKYELLKTSCGSPCYAPPEMIEGKKYHGLSADIWSCGVVLFVMLSGFLPFDDPNTNNLYKKILSANYKIPKFITVEAQEIIAKILNPDPIKRFTIPDIRAHPWFNVHKNLNVFKGIQIGINRIPIDIIILNQMERYNYQTKEVQKALEANCHQSDTTTYYLLLKQKLQTGVQKIQVKQTEQGKSPADLTSETFQLGEIWRRSSHQSHDFLETRLDFSLQIEKEKRVNNFTKNLPEATTSSSRIMDSKKQYSSLDSKDTIHLPQKSLPPIKQIREKQKKIKIKQQGIFRNEPSIIRSIYRVKKI